MGNTRRHKLSKSGMGHNIKAEFIMDSVAKAKTQCGGKGRNLLDHLAT
jgi:hypothetical protein